MRWSIIRVIWMRELRDQLRDRRTILMIAVLPVLLYPLLGVGLMQLAPGFTQKPCVVGIYGTDDLLKGQTARVDAIPPLLVESGDSLKPAPAYSDQPIKTNLGNLGQSSMEVRSLAGDSGIAGNDLSDPDADALAAYRKPLADHTVDLVVVVPRDFLQRMSDEEHPSLLVLDRENDEHSRNAKEYFSRVLNRWKKAIKEVRFTRRGLPANFDDPFRIDDPHQAKPAAERAATDLFALMLRMFPFILVMWSLAGALYPAVDLCAGEKERGTMETLLISPASREEIVWGKFLTIWVFSAATALLNLFSMGVTAWQTSRYLPNDAFRPAVLFWSVLLVLPLSAFFSAVCLAVGAYARSSKEGQYYLMPLFLVTLPLVFITLLPGVELNPLYSMMPVTGVALLLQKLISPDPQESIPWLYFLPVLAPMVVYSWLALRWAVAQFQSEEVLFREAERLDVGLWLRRLFREKEKLPTIGQALFCFALLLVLRWLSLGFVHDQEGLGAYLLSLTAVCQLAFTAAPALFMALLLITRPRQGLALRLPPLWSWPASALLAVLCVPPLAMLTLLILNQFPAIKQLLEEYHPLTGALQSGTAQPFLYLLVLAVLPAICEELAFRGFILTGLRRRFQPWTAVLLSSFLFALFQMNVFQFAPHFILGVILGSIAVRTGSVAPAMVFHLVYNLCLFAPLMLGDMTSTLGGIALGSEMQFVLAAVSALLAAGLLSAMLLLGQKVQVTSDQSTADQDAGFPFPSTNGKTVAAALPVSVLKDQTAYTPFDKEA